MAIVAGTNMGKGTSGQGHAGPFPRLYARTARFTLVPTRSLGAAPIG
jgi:hypothetical protein